MQLPNWSREKQQWDEFKAFHVGINMHGTAMRGPYSSHVNGINFVMFETGELICTADNIRPAHRGLYAALNVGLWRTCDSDCPKLFTPDGEPIPKARLNHGGSQLILVDNDTRRAVSLRKWHADAPVEPDVRPARFRDRPTNVYFPGPGMPPYAAGAITVCPPVRVLDKDYAKQVEDRVATVRAAMALLDHPATRPVSRTYTPTGGLAKGQPQVCYDPVPTSPLPMDRLMETEWQKLHEHELRRFWFAGLDRPHFKYPYLLTEKP
jgi:hypothetical protein